MRKMNLITGAAIIVLVACCAEKKEEVRERQRFISTDGLIELECPPGWFKNEDDNPFDLQCFSKDERMTTGVFSFHRMDLAADLTAREVLELQIENVKSKRRNFTVVEEQTVTHYDSKRLTSIVYSGVRLLSNDYYRFTLVEFLNNPETFAVVIQTAIPSDWGRNKGILEDITRSAMQSSQREFVRSDTYN
jgi:hypothetical protein